jgi:hypothetical protein
LIYQPYELYYNIDNITQGDLRMKKFFLLPTMIIPFLLSAKPVPAAVQSIRPQPIPTPIRDYGKPVAPQIPATVQPRPPAQRPPYNQVVDKPALPKPPAPKPKPPRPRPPRPHGVIPTVPVYNPAAAVEYTFAWYKDSYVILYKGWFWYKKQWVWGGQGKAPAPPAWRPE